MTRFSTDRHPRRYGDFSWVYPVWSRRRGGISLGINLNPDKICNFACVYCQVDRTVPGHVADVDAAGVLAELERVLGAAEAGHLTELPGFDRLADDPAAPPAALLDVSFSGDGEPTTARAFPDLVDATLARLARSALDIPVIVFTNATRADKPRVLAALRRVMAAGGQVWAKLDAGTDEGLRRWAGVAMPADRLGATLTALATPGPLTIQTLLCRDADGPIPLAEVEAIGARLAAIAAAGGAVDEVQIHTVARPTPDPAVRALTAAELHERADLLRAAQPFDVRVY